VADIQTGIRYENCKRLLRSPPVVTSSGQHHDVDVGCGKSPAVPS
jgi:hypothetical protein